MIIIGRITVERKKRQLLLFRGACWLSSSRSQPQLWSSAATRAECHQAGPAAVSSTVSTEQPDLNKASSFNSGTSEWGYLSRLWFSCSVDVRKGKKKRKEKGNKVVALTCWRVITTKSREGKRSGCEEDKRETWQSLHGHPRMSLLSHSDSSSVTFKRADNCTNSSCHTVFFLKKKGQVVPASFISNWTGSSTLDGPENTSKNKTHWSDNW